MVSRWVSGERETKAAFLSTTWSKGKLNQGSSQEEEEGGGAPPKTCQAPYKITMGVLMIFEFVLAPPETKSWLRP